MSSPDKPQFHGDPRNDADLLRYEQAVREWEQARADAEYYDELYKADAPEELTMREAFGQFLDDPEFRERSRGPEGLPGMNGAPGPPGPPGSGGGGGGNDWRTGAGPPTIIAGDVDGDMYLNESNGDVYQMQASAWVLVANIAGPAGADGVDGATGPAGADGVDGATGPAGADGSDASNFTTQHAYSIGPKANQALSATPIVLDMDTSRAEQDPADWTLSATGEWTWSGGVAATFLIAWNATIFESAGTSILSRTWLEINNLEYIGTRTLQTVQANSYEVVSGQAIVTLADADVVRIRVIGSGLGTAHAYRAMSNISLVRIK